MRRTNIIILSSGVILLLLVSIVLLVAASSGRVVEAQAGPFKPPRPLVGASPEEVGQAAKDYTAGQFKVLSGTPTVLLARPVTKEDLPKLGLPEIGFSASEDPPLMLVALKGDFDVSSLQMSGGASPWKVGYIVYVFDLKAGMPTLTLVSPRGGTFRTLLNDPTLPEDTAQTPNTAQNTNQPTEDPNIPLPSPVPANPSHKYPYGTIAPTVLPTSSPTSSEQK